MVTIDGFEDVPEKDEEALLKAAAHQPVSVAIEADKKSFQLYDGELPHLPNEYIRPVQRAGLCLRPVLLSAVCRCLTALHAMHILLWQCSDETFTVKLGESLFCTIHFLI